MSGSGSQIVANPLFQKAANMSASALSSRQSSLLWGAGGESRRCLFQTLPLDGMTHDDYVDDFHSINNTPPGPPGGVSEADDPAPNRMIHARSRRLDSRERIPWGQSARVFPCVRSRGRNRPRMLRCKTVARRCRLCRLYRLCSPAACRNTCCRRPGCHRRLAPSGTLFQRAAMMLASGPPLRWQGIDRSRLGLRVRRRSAFPRLNHPGRRP